LSGEGRALELGAVAVEHPDLRDDLRDEFPVVKHPHHRALRDRDRYGVCVPGDGGGGHVPAPETQGDVQVVGGRVYVAGRREDDALVGDHEGPVELGELLEGLANIRIVDALFLVGMASQGVQDQGPGGLQHRVRVADNEEGTDLASLSALAGDLHGERDGLLEYARVHPALLRADLLDQFLPRLQALSSVSLSGIRR